MHNLIMNGHWIIWLYIIVLFPFQLYDFSKREKRKLKDYIYILFITIVLSLYAYGFLSGRYQSDIKLLTEDWVYWLLVFLVYIQSIYEFICKRSKRNTAFFAILTVVILLYIILYNL